MKEKKKPLDYLKIIFTFKSLALLGIAAILNSCFLQFDRTTTVYGTITDHNEQPVDSILVLVTGVKFLTYERLKEIFTDENGNYEMVIDVPKKFGSVNVIVPFGNENRKYDRNYKGIQVKKDDKATNNCCIASIGEKTKYDFQLIPR